MNKLTEFGKKRKKIVNYYNQKFKSVKNVLIPFESSDCQSNFHLYVLLFDFLKIGKNREQCMEELKRQGIGTQVHYIPVVLQPFYKERCKADLNDYLNTKKYYDQCLSIPLYPGMKDEEVAHVVDCIKRMVS